MHLQTIALVVNKKAGNGKAIQMAEHLSMWLSRKGIQYELFRESWPPAFDSFSDVWIVGGDGTLNYFINRYPSIQLPLSIFKGGTGNDFAFTLYGDRKLEEQAEHVLNVRPQPVDAGVCNAYLFLNGVGIGFDGEVLKRMNSIRRLGGHLGYLFEVIRQIFFFREFRFRIYTPDLLVDEKLLLVMVHNSGRTGGGFLVSPKSAVDDGLLDLVIAKPLNLLQRLYYLPVIQKGKHLHLPVVRHVMGAHFTIECEQELPGQLDGELITAQRFTMSVLKGKFLFRY